MYTLKFNVHVQRKLPKLPKKLLWPHRSWYQVRRAVQQVQDSLSFEIPDDFKEMDKDNSKTNYENRNGSHTNHKDQNYDLFCTLPAVDFDF